LSSSSDKPADKSNKPKRNTLGIKPEAGSGSTKKEDAGWRPPVRGRHAPRTRVASADVPKRGKDGAPSISKKVRPEPAERAPRAPYNDRSNDRPGDKPRRTERPDQAERRPERSGRPDFGGQSADRGETSGRGRSSGRAGYTERDKSARPASDNNPRRREISPETRAELDRPSYAKPTHAKPAYNKPAYDKPRHDSSSYDRLRQDKPAPQPRGAYRAPVGYQFFASCPRGLEEELCKELDGLGATDIVPASGGVGFISDMPTGWKINLWSRLAIRVLWRVGEGHYKKEEDLYQAALALDWPSWFDVSRTIAVTTVGKNSPLPSLNFVSLRIKDAICDRFREATGERPNVDTRKPDIPLTLFLSSDRYNLYLDLSGEPLNRRGYRVQPSGAPLNENLAAGMLLLSGWTPGTPLYDPMMGGGTILLEAAMMTLNIAPGLRRHFAFENLKTFDRIEWLRLHKDAEAAVLEREPLPIFGSDIDPAMLRAAGLNLRAAGLFDCVRLMEADFLNVDPPTESGFIVSNPPYGVRMGSEEDLGPFYKEIGDNLKQHFPGWTVFLLSADPELPKRIGLQTTRRIPLYNGPLECRLVEYRLVAGSNRKE
jgi:putative N6-adenine-specific DNA methylase